MIKTKRCKFLGCSHQPLEDPDELGNGLCHRHIKEFKDPSYLTLCCWNCGSLLETVHKKKFLKGVAVDDDYIFAKTCPNCSDVHLDSLQFVTITDKSDDQSLLVGEGGKTVGTIASVRGAKALGPNSPASEKYATK